MVKAFCLWNSSLLCHGLSRELAKSGANRFMIGYGQRLQNEAISLKFLSSLKIETILSAVQKLRNTFTRLK